MKKIIALLLLTNIASSSFGMEYLKNFFPVSIKVKPADYAIKPCVKVIELIDSIDFDDASLKLIVAAKSSEISGVILIIDSCGGSTGPFSVLHDLIKKLAAIKPVVVLILGDAQSCGYMIAAPAHYIIAHSFSDIGSIGIMFTHERHKDVIIEDNETRAAMDVELFYAGEFKAAYNRYHTLTDNDRRYIQENVNRSYQEFVSMISQDRNLDIAEYKTWAEGKGFIASQALELGLIDEIGTIFEAEAKMLELIRQRNPDCVFADEIVTNLLPPLQ